MKELIAKKYQHQKGGLRLDPEALKKYNDIIDLSIGDTDLITDDSIIEAAFRDAKKGYTRYGVPKGDPELVDAICRFWREDFDESVSPDEVIVTASSLLGATLCMMAMLDPGDEVIVFSPYFSLYKQQIEMAGGVCVEVPTYAEEDFAIREDRLLAAITPKTKAILLNNPNNPTGAAYSRSDLEQLADIAREYDLYFIADEIYTTYMFDTEFVPMRTLPGMRERTITLNSFSKNFMMTGWRLGCTVADPRLIETMNKINGSIVYSAPSVSQRAGIEALAQRRKIREQYISVYEERVLYAADRCARIPWMDIVRPGGTFYLFPGFKRTGLTSAEFCQKLLDEAHIIVASGALFGSTGEGHVRMACTIDIEKIKEAFDRIEKLQF